MKRQLGRTTACLATIGLVATSLVAGSASAAAPANAVLFGQANIKGYATGTEVHTDALTLGTTKLLDLEQAFSGATTSSAGLTTPIKNELKTVVQPAEPASVNAFGTGDGLELGLATPTTAETDANQILLGGKPEAVAPPDNPPVFKNLLSIGSGSTAALGALVKADVLNGEGAAIYDPAQCPIGQPISFGIGNAAAVQVLPLPGSVRGLVSTTGQSTAVAQSSSETYLSPNGDSTWGLSSNVTTDIAPVSINLGTTASIQVSVNTNKGLDEPVTLTAKTTGESGGSVTVSNNDVVTIALVTTMSGKTTTTNLIQVPLGNLTAKNNGVVQLPLDLAKLNITIQNAINVLAGLASSLPSPLNTTLSTLVGAIQTAATTLLIPLTSPLKMLAGVIDVNLGEIDIESLPHAIGALPTVKPTPTGTSASGAIDLVKAAVGLSLTGSIGANVPAPLNGLSIANAAVGHMEVSANTSAPITCSIPVTKVADPPSVTAGNPFTYTIDVPDPAKLSFIDCNLSNMTVTDVISDKPGTSPTFAVNSATAEQENSSGQLVPIPGATATITPAAGTTTQNATVTWTGLTWQLGTKPLQFVINMSVPKTSPAGVIQDTATATAVLTGCSGGASGSTSASATAANGQPLTGSVTLQAPSVAALTSVTSGNAPGAKKTLPFTGAMGGPWQPIGGLLALGLGGSAFALVRRSRRRRPIS